MRHLFLTGEIQVGKSTLLSRWLSRTDCRIGGFCTRRLPEKEHAYVRIFPADPGAEPIADNILFDTMDRTAWDSDARFNTTGCALLAGSEDRDLIVMDEIGFQEDTAAAFCEAVLKTLDGPAPVIGVLRKKRPDRIAGSQSGSLADRIISRPDVSVIEVTKDNRHELAAVLPDILLPFSV